MKDHQVLTESDKSNPRSEAVIASLSSLVLSFMIMFVSPLNPVTRTDYVEMDSAVFRTIGYVMSRGGLPYRDSFDHKGPVVYLLNYLGDRVISATFGLWLIEVLFLAFSILVFYYTARLICSKISSFFVVMSAISLIMLFFERGNFVEEYALPFIALGNLIFLDYFLNNKITSFRVILSGICLGMVLMLRPNMIALWIVFCIAVLIKLIYSKKIKVLLKFIALFIPGIAIVFIPILFWLGINGSLPDFWKDYIVFNFVYASAGEAKSVVTGRIDSLIFFISVPLFLISLLSSLAFTFIKKDKVSILTLIYGLLSLIFVVMPGRIYDHYGLVLIPCTIYPLCLLIDSAKLIKREKIKKWIGNLIPLVLTFAFIIPCWIVLGISLWAPDTTVNEMDEYYRTSAEKVAGIVESGSAPDDKIFVFGNWDCIYLMTDRMPATKYSYQYPPCYLAPELMEDCFRELKEDKPKLIVVQAGQYNMIGWFIDSFDYELVWSEDPDDLLGSISVFKLN